MEGGEMQTIKKEENPKIKILVGYHKPAVLLKDDILTPIHLGRALVTEASKDGEMSKEDFEWMCENMIGDDTGDNISHLNRYFCELTGIYWAWKNYDKLGNPDYIGFSHYRRHLIFDETFQLSPAKWANFSPTYENISLKYKHIIRIEKLTNKEEYDIFVPKIFNVTLRSDVSVSTVAENFQTYCYDMSGLDLLIELLENDDKLKEYKKYSNLKSETSYFLANVFVMKKEIFFAYCDFLFYVMFKLLRSQLSKLELNSDLQQKRQCGYISEFVISIYLRKQFDLQKRIKSLPLSFVENTNDAVVLNELKVLKIKEKSMHCAVISFDLFDTLLVRPYSTPQDVFLHLEERYGVKGFAEDRANAENKARILLNKKLVNYDEIYACMPQMYRFLKEKEQELEFETLYVNPEMKVIYDYLIKQGKKIVFTSDMYYSEDFFRELLDKNDIKGYHKIYISGVVNKSKHHGDLYQYILDDLKIKASDIIHIGDNYYVDYQQANNNGLQALHYEAPILQFFNSFPRLRRFYDENNNLTSHIIIGILLKKWLQSNKKMDSYWEYFGYFYGGPICYGLSNFVYDEAIKEGLKEFIFVARDGYIIEKIFNLLQKQFNTNIKTAYVYAPRTLHLQINLEVKKEFQWVDKASSLIRLFKDDILDFKNVSENNLTQEYKERLINKNIKLLKQITQKVTKSYQNYIQSFNFKEKNIGLFDISAGTFSSMKLLKIFLKNKHILGYYWIVAGDKYKEIFSYKTYNNEKYFLNNYELSELIITAPELPIKSIDDNGDFTRIDNSYEQKRVEIYKIISHEELKFSRDLLNTFGDTKVNFENKTLINFLNIFISNLDENDRYFFNDVYHGMSEDHVVYRKLFVDDNQKGNSVDNIGAVNIVKNHLSYKLGQEIINAKKFSKMIFLPFRLIKIVLMHKKIQWSKKQLENPNPTLKSLPLSYYSDYHEAMKIKNYLSYKLGNLLIKHPFTFIFRVGKVYKEWKEGE
ncbi:DUF4422 domain-containing protein [Campylobacter coli]|nr:DUF4422 domain-containing protein [Campylobacter coli]